MLELVQCKQALLIAFGVHTGFRGVVGYKFMSCARGQGLSWADPSTSFLALETLAIIASDFRV